MTNVVSRYPSESLKHFISTITTTFSALNLFQWRSHAIIGGANIHVFVFTHRKNNRFQKKLMT